MSGLQWSDCTDSEIASELAKTIHTGNAGSVSVPWHTGKVCSVGSVLAVSRTDLRLHDFVGH